MKKKDTGAAAEQAARQAVSRQAASKRAASKQASSKQVRQAAAEPKKPAGGPVLRLAGAYIRDPRGTALKMKRYKKLRRNLSRAAALGVRLFNAFRRETIARKG